MVAVLRNHAFISTTADSQFSIRIHQTAIPLAIAIGNATTTYHCEAAQKMLPLAATGISIIILPEDLHAIVKTRYQ